jgi:hypothetical protein
VVRLSISSPSPPPFLPTMGLTAVIDTLKTASLLTAVIPVAGTICEKLIGAAAHVCEVAEVRSYTSQTPCLYIDSTFYTQRAQTNQENYERLGTKIAGYATAVASKTRERYGSTTGQTSDPLSFSTSELFELWQYTEELIKYVNDTPYSSSLMHSSPQGF